MKSALWKNLLLWFFPTRYFESAEDLQDWNQNYRKEYATFSRGAALAAMIISVILYFVADLNRFTSDNLYVAIIYRLFVLSVGSVVISYTFTKHYYSSKYYKLPVFLLAIGASFFEAYIDLHLDNRTPLYYSYLIPFLGVWICQLGPALSVLVLAAILFPISYDVVLIHGFEQFYFFNAISLTMLSMAMLFLMRLEMINKIKYFLINKKYLEETRLRLEETKLRYKETELRYKELGDLATQVAHDIRSPLSAVMILAKDDPNIPEENRILFRTGVTRILDITNDLLKRGKVFLDSTKQEINLSESERSLHLITNIIESIVSEKRVELRPKLNIQIHTNLDSNAFGVFANIQKSELKRILSNLINNSVEAVKEKGRIEISASLVSDAINISVQDNGVGIPADVLPKLLKRGASFNKGENNLGVGLYHAQSKITDWGGNIAITSEVNKGTKVTLTLPTCAAPKWFADKIEILSGTKIVVLDDDLAIHQVWDRRFKKLIANNSDIEIIHLSTVKQFDLWFQGNNNSDALYLVDYELLGQSKNGIDVISSLGIQDKAILVTGRSEEHALIDKCVNLGIKILPKVSADMIQIEMPAIK